ncbi:MAG: hypothetical protein AB1797_01440 [bacterium]
MLDARSSMLDLRCWQRIQYPGSSIQDRGSRLCLRALVAERLQIKILVKFQELSNKIKGENRIIWTI